MTEETERRGCFEAEVFRLMDRLYGRALRLTANTADAEDLVADTVAKAWAKLEELRDLRCLEPWLFRILTNTYISAWRHRSGSSVEVTADADEQGQESNEFSLFEQLHQPFLLWWSSPEHDFLNNVLREDMEKALDSLPDEFRIAVVLVLVEGYTYAEAAELLEVPIGTVRSRLNRGRGLLQRALWEQAGQTGLKNRQHANEDDMPVTRPLNCEEVLKHLLAYIDKELDAEISAEIDRHLEQCRGCFSRADFERKLNAKLAQTSLSNTPEHLRSRVKVLIEKF